MTGERGTERERRISLNEAVFRRMNEQLKALAEQFELDREPLLLVCECGYSECDRRLRIPPADYERVRGEARAFFVVPGHELEDVERVVERNRDFNVVMKKPGISSEIAQATAP
jgi:hypothetical protein